MKALRAQSGQVMVEAMLTLILFLGVSLFVVKQAKQNEWFSSLMSGPWTAVSNMIENGVWDSNVKTARAQNPTRYSRVVSFKGAPEH